MFSTNTTTITPGVAPHGEPVRTSAAWRDLIGPGFASGTSERVMLTAISAARAGYTS